VDGDVGILGRTVDLDAAHRGLGEFLAQEVADLEIGVEQIGIVLGIGIPLGCPVLDDAKPDTIRMNFLSQYAPPARPKCPYASSTSRFFI